MNTQQQINSLHTRQLELLVIMAASDDHASKCTKRGVSFREAYPEDFDAYQAANDEYNTNEARIADLKVQIADETKSHDTEQWTGRR